jgi:hypothetical protein
MMMKRMRMSRRPATQTTRSQHSNCPTPLDRRKCAAMFRTGAQMAILIVLAGLFLLREAHWWPMNAVDEAFADHIALAERRATDWARQRGWAPPTRTMPVVLVAIDENSLADHPWPWNPLDFSLFLRAAQTFRPDVVVIDEVLDWDHTNLPASERQKLPQYERMLRDTLLRTPKVLLGQRLGWPDDPDVVPPLHEAPFFRRVTGNLLEVPEWTAIEAQPKEEFRLSSAVGFTNLPQGLPSTTKVPLVLRYQGQIVPSLVLQAAILWHKLSADEIEVVLGSHVALGPKRRIPIDKRGQMRLNFGAEALRIGYDELLLAAEQVAAKQKPKIPVERLAGSIALLSRTDPASRTLPVTLRGRVSPGEILATAIATIQGGVYPSLAPRWFNFALIGVAALAGLMIPRWKRTTVALGAFAVLLLYLLTAVAVMHLEGICLPLVLPVGLLLFIVLYRAATPNSVWRLRRPVIL